MSSLIVSGTPAATLVEVPKLERMSLRTTPLWVRMSGPFDPSPGYGPAVSSGITSHVPTALEAADDDPAVELADELRMAPGAQPTIVNSPAARPALPRSFIACRRSIIRVSRSNANPWSKMGSLGSGNARLVSRSMAWASVWVILEPTVAGRDFQNRYGANADKPGGVSAGDRPRSGRRGWGMERAARPGRRRCR